jgi:AraC-like DNA-binding protein
MASRSLDGSKLQIARARGCSDSFESRVHRCRDKSDTRRSQAAARATLDSRVSDLCEALAVSQRTLTRALRAVRHTTPSRHLRALRLSEARKALVSADAAAETVTQVALRFGFRELGRFAVDYRAAFGESPSDTLRRSAAASRRKANGRRRG